MKQRRCIANLALWLMVVVSYFPSAAFGAEPIRADFLLRNGQVHDGSGSAPKQGDVAIRGDRIVAVGAAEVVAAVVIDCTGLVIAPGFIDLHNHSDAQIVDAKTRSNVNFLLQGCTTVVTGNCGFGPVDTGDYYRQLDEHGAGTNVVHLIPQGSLRGEVFGSANRPPTETELAEMRRLCDKAMRDGAWGMSTGLIYVPSSYANTEELIELAKVVSQHGGLYASHIRGENLELLKSVDEALRIGREANLPVHVSHFKASGQDAWGLVREAAKMIEAARESGQRVTADQYPYTASSTSLEATVIPTWARAGGQKELLKRLDDPEIGPRLKNEIQASLHKKEGGTRLRIARYAPRQDWVGLNLDQIAGKEKSTPLDIALEITRQGGAAIVNFNMSEDDIRHVMQIPWVATASDGRAYLPGSDRPHPRNYGTFPRKLGVYARDEQVVEFNQALRSCNGLPADILGLPDRGYLKEGYAADVVVFDPKTIIDRATFDDPHQYAAGMQHVFVNGQPAVHRGQPTGALSGKPLRHAADK